MINYLMDVCMPQYFWFLDTVLGTPSDHMSLVEWMVGHTDGCMDVWKGGQLDPLHAHLSPSVAH